jgi:hypothetical protein
MNVQTGGIPTQRKSTKAKASKALTTVAEGAIEKPVVAPAISAESMSIDLSGDEDTQMKLLRRSMRSKAKPETYVPGSIQPKKTRGTLTPEQKAARAAARVAALAAKEEAIRALPNPEDIEKMRKQQEVMRRAQELYASQMEQDPKRSRGTKIKQMEERRWKAAVAEAEKQIATEKKEEKKALASEADILADLFGQMTTSRPVVAPTPIGQAMHSSGHPIVGYDPRDGWPLGVNPVTGQVERFATKDGGKKKRTYNKKSKIQKGGEVEGAAENEASLPAPVSGGKKKRTYKKKSKSQKGGEVEGAVAENEKSLPSPVDQSGGKKKRTKKQK